MIFGLVGCAEENWSRLDCSDHLAKLLTGVKFKNGVEATKGDLFANWGGAQNTILGNNKINYL